MFRSAVGILYVLVVWNFIFIESRTFCTEHPCDINKCLPQQWVCDGEQDCHDGSDEMHCVEEQCEEGIDFQCANHVQCVLMKWKCDGDKDCHDGSDELDCANMTCAEDHVSCGPGNGCIHSSFVCDGHVDCPGGLDEKIGTCKNRTCLVDEFQCHSDHRCITDRWRCDGDMDCDDRSDEKDCPEPSCDGDHFQCLVNTTQCIPLKWQCDRGYDCIDRTDEDHCDYDEHSQHCDANEFSCRIDRVCVHNAWVCDGDADCEDASDEANCHPLTCKANEFQCRKVGNCIPAHWKCDGNAQCDDRSDEDGCVLRPPCSSHTEFDCSGGKEPHCIPLSQVCNDINDCGKYEDEKPELCNHLRNLTNLCKVNNGGCSHNCVPTKLGYYCSCRVGFKLATDNETCEDFDECSIPGSCSQVCENLKGGFKCSCRDGYELSPSNHQTCLAEGEPSLIFANRHEVISVNLRRNNSRLLRNDLANSRVLDYDFDSHIMFLYDALNQSISQFSIEHSLNVSKGELLASGRMKSVDGMAYDWIHKNLYWTDSGYNHIEVLSLKRDSKGLWRKTLISGLDVPKAIVLDPRSQKYVMYWTECGRSPKIRSAFLDGTNLRDIVLPGSDVVWPNGLTLDYETDILYWTDMKLHLIASISVGFSSRRDRRVILTSHMFLKHPYSLTVFEDFLYWSDWQNQSVLKVNKFSANSANITRVISRLHMPMGVQIYHKLRQPSGVSVCVNQCSHICLPTYSYKKFSCICPNSDAMTSYKLGPDPKTCIVINSTDLPAEDTSVPSLLLQNSSNPVDQESGKIITIIVPIMSLIMIAVAVISYFVIKRYKRRSIKSMNFDNPVYRKRSEDQFSLEKNEYNPSINLPEGVIELAEPLRLSCENYVMTEK